MRQLKPVHLSLLAVVLSVLVPVKAFAELNTADVVSTIKGASTAVDAVGLAIIGVATGMLVIGLIVGMILRKGR